MIYLTSRNVFNLRSVYKLSIKDIYLFDVIGLLGVADWNDDWMGWVRN